MEEFVFPKNYDDWRQTITIQGGIELTSDYISQRLTALRNEKDPTTQNFIKLYGSEYHQQVVSWFEQEQKTNGVSS